MPEGDPAFKKERRLVERIVLSPSAIRHLHLNWTQRFKEVLRYLENYIALGCAAEVPFQSEFSIV